MTSLVLISSDPSKDWGEKEILDGVNCVCSDGTRIVSPEGTITFSHVVIDQNVFEDNNRGLELLRTIITNSGKRFVNAFLHQNGPQIGDGELRKLVHEKLGSSFCCTMTLFSHVPQHEDIKEYLQQVLEVVRKGRSHD